MIMGRKKAEETRVILSLYLPISVKREFNQRVKKSGKTRAEFIKHLMKLKDNE